MATVLAEVSGESRVSRGEQFFSRKIFEFNFQVPTSIFNLNIRWCKSWVPISISGLRTGGESSIQTTSSARFLANLASEL
nr:hypothetical protein CFP56_47970 [Quercus suber]